jgi:hypothetical protein
VHSQVSDEETWRRSNDVSKVLLGRLDVRWQVDRA